MPFPNKRDAATDAKAKAAYELRMQYLAYADIAEQLGYTSAMGAWHAVKRHIKRHVPDEDAQEMRLEMRMQLGRALKAINRFIENGDIDAIKAGVAVHARIAALYGLDTPPIPAAGTQNITRKYIVVHKSAAPELPTEAQVTSNGHNTASVGNLG